MLGNPVSFLPVFWLLGLAPIYPFLFGGYLLFWVRASRRIGQQCAYVVFALTAYSFVYFFSILYNTEFSIDERTLGGAYNLSLIVSAIPILIGAAKLLHPKYQGYLESVGNSSALVLVLACALGGPLVYLFEEQSLVVLPSLLSSLINVDSLPPLARDSINLLIVAPDWGGEEVKGRLTILAPYANALAGLAVVLMGLAYRGRPRQVALAVVFGLVLAVLTRSRIGILCAAAVFFFYFFTILLKNKLLPLGALAAAGLSVVVALFYVSGVDDGPKGISRDASDHLRSVLYYESVVRALDNEPLVGLGVKPRLESYEMPLGSHSAFIGAFYKTGIVGFTFFLAAFLVILLRGMSLVVRGVRARDPRMSLVGSSVASVFFFFFFEDVDAPQLLLASYFLLCGLVLNDRDGGLDESASNYAAPAR